MVSVAKMTERSVVMSFVPRRGKAIKHEPVEENNMLSREFQRDGREKSSKGQCFPSGGLQAYLVLQSVLSKNTNPVSGDRRFFSEYAARSSKICDCNTNKRELSIRDVMCANMQRIGLEL